MLFASCLLTRCRCELRHCGEFKPHLQANRHIVRSLLCLCQLIASILWSVFSLYEWRYHMYAIRWRLLVPSTVSILSVFAFLGIPTTPCQCAKQVVSSTSSNQNFIRDLFLFRQSFLLCLVEHHDQSCCLLLVRRQNSLDLLELLLKGILFLSVHLDPSLDLLSQLPQAFSLLWDLFGVSGCLLFWRFCVATYQVVSALARICVIVSEISPFTVS